jgi:hypothetical protein
MDICPTLSVSSSLSSFFIFLLIPIHTHLNSRCDFALDYFIFRNLESDPPFEMLSRSTTPAISWLYPPRSLLRPLAVEIVEREEEWMSMLSVFFNFGASFSSLSLFRSLLDRAVAIVSIPLALKGNQIHERDCCTMCVLWVLFCGVCTALYIYRNWVSPSSLFSRRGGRRAGWHQFHFFFLLFVSFLPLFTFSSSLVI